MTMFEKSAIISGPPIPSQQPRMAAPLVGPGAVSEPVGRPLPMMGIDDSPPTSDAEGLNLRTLREVGVRVPPKSVVSASLNGSLAPFHPREPDQRRIVSQSVDRASRNTIGNKDGVGGDDYSLASRDSNGSSASKFSRTKARKARSIERGRRLRSLATQQLDDDGVSLFSGSSAARADAHADSRSPKRTTGASRAALYQPAAHYDEDGDSKPSFGSEDDFSHRRRKRLQAQSGPGSQPDKLIGFKGDNALSAVNFVASSSDAVRMDIFEVNHTQTRPDHIPPTSSPIQPTPDKVGQSTSPERQRTTPAGSGQQQTQGDSKFPMFF
jgi:hypothetical protein